MCTPSTFILLVMLAACNTAQAPTAGAPATPSPAKEAPRATTTPASEGGRAAADIAFNEAMTAFETGGPTASILVPSAIERYQRLLQLDSDGLFHLALLQAAAGDAKASRLTAEQILAQRGTHLLGLGIACRAASLQGDDIGGRAYAQRLVTAWGSEQGSLPEYLDHRVLLDRYHADALAMTAGSAPDR